ncbi:MAG: phenylalanine--tRNA ligase subunit beta [Crocinitomicaceae bacterium]|jgi:phenylalanyl-tRNA synthetase beta chain|nr:phenylalanine--tRNA ligase subunit beta [Crocinitomicaceae bacterium]
MKIAYSWLKDYVQTDLSVDEISKILTETGLEVDGVEKIESVKGGLEGVVVGEVLSCEKHPDADKLKVTTVTIGGEPLQIVCGAPNVAAGQKVIVATVGCTLYPKPDEAFKIKASKIRGVESNGMLCAEDELGLGESHAGILVLQQDTPVGMPAAEYFDLADDYVIEIGLTPNRADAMGHIGVARDLVAYLNYHKKASLKLRMPEVKKLEANSQSLPHSITIEEAELCPKYFGVSIQNVKVDASPAWLQKRLRAVGLSPINNIVDCTNYVMRELGTPLHAFDCAALNGKIVVKLAENGAKFTTLDGVERTLDSSNLVITNGEKNLAIAGVFGGLDSGISENTTNVFIESAYFNPVSVRKTAKMHGLSTDASFRYERGVDPHLTRFALERVVNLIQELAGGEIAMDLLEAYPHKIENQTVDFRPDYCNKVIGTEIPPADMKQILGDLDIQVLAEDKESWKLEVPAYRVDVTREIDVVEEILRIYGFNQVPLPEKLNSNLTLSVKPNLEKIQHTLAELLVSNGFSEMMNNSLTSSLYLEKIQQNVLLKENNIEILNPLSQDLDVMRQTLVYNALEVVEHNQNRQNPDLKLFEFGKIYRKNGEKYEEEKRLILVLSGNKYEEQWNNPKDKASFYTLKGVVNSLLGRIGLSSFVQESALENSLLADGVKLSVLKDEIGQMGWVSSALKKQFGIKNEVFIADLSWDAICKNLRLNKVIFKEIPKTFEMRRDFSLLLDESVRFSDIEKLAKNADKKILKRVGLFDVYEGKNLEAGKKSYAVSFYFQDNEQTLKDQAVDTIMQKIRTELETRLGAQLR